ncbi:hypothetical protein FSP39_016574, partial [Pinctada imbricata]
DMTPERYFGPSIVADAVERCFPQHRQSLLVLDIAAGTGLLGYELKMRGFDNLHALDPSEGMLNKAKKKNIYNQFYCEYMTENVAIIPSDVYDCVVCSGGFGQGHIPTSALREMARITKPGGYGVIVIREEFLDSPEYENSLENMMVELENIGIWKKIERSVVPKYFCHKSGVIYRFRVCDDNE